MPRVIAGSARSVSLDTPEGLDTRPTTDRVKETLFNMIQWDIADGVVVDFFSGSGALGIECISRGAKHAYFADNSREAVKCIDSNLKRTHFEDKATVFTTDAVRAAHMINEKHVDIIFMDPPYNKGLEADMLSTFKNCAYVDRDTLIIIEAELDTDFSYVDDLGYTVSKVKEYKTNKHVFVRLK
ncbi:MAG: 16S rRNA (guanine(966)-N(2))-methyltransferase RsmD [Lachnospiraceae bacterium]|nr:16S rRNA (guanine(966)-N(2))-methyltransferase RsmD [Lachnospiraceae bacterium]